MRTTDNCAIYTIMTSYIHRYRRDSEKEMTSPLLVFLAEDHMAAAFSAGENKHLLMVGHTLHNTENTPIILLLDFVLTDKTNYRIRCG